jgi:hypothetical protein
VNQAALNSAFAVLCEGAADKAFLEALRLRRNLPLFDVPFPPPNLARGARPLYGRDHFGNMLEVIATDVRSAPALALRGIVIVADAFENVGETFDYVSRQCQRSGFAPPISLATWSQSVPPFPPVAILTVPDCDPGGLETLCLAALRPRYAQVATCLDSFQACVPPIQRTAEKRDKAALACFTAAVHPSDPTRTLKRVFRGQDALIDVTDAAFDGVADRLTALFSSVVSLPTAP